MGHNSTGGGQNLEQQILTYMAKCRNESRENFLWMKAKLEEQSAALEEHSAAIKELKEEVVKFKEHSASVNSWADVYEYSKEEENEEDVPVLPPSPGDFFRRQELGTVEGNDTNYDSISQEDISLDEEHGVLKVDDSSVGEEEVTIEEVGNSGVAGGNREQDDDNDDEVQILDEVLKSNGKAYSPSGVEIVEAQPGPSSKIPNGNSGKPNENTRRPSIFTHVKKTGIEGGGPRVSQGRQMPDLSNSLGSDDFFNKGNTPESSTADGDVGDVNDIFDGMPNTCDPPPPILSPAIPKRKNRSDDPRERKIKKIAKAPIKEEPTQLQSLSYLHDDLLSMSGSPHPHALPSPPLSNREEDADEGGSMEQQEHLRPPILPCLIKDIKVERQAHALKDKKPDSEGRYFCICGHFVFTKSGIQSHVRKKGCEEPRFLCPENGCDKKVVYTYEMRHHLLSIHGKSYAELYGCKKCSAYFFDKKSSKAHRKAGNCKKHSSRRKGQAVELNRAPIATVLPGTSSSAIATSVIRGLPPQSFATELGRPSQIITM